MSCHLGQRKERGTCGGGEWRSGKYISSRVGCKDVSNPVKELAHFDVDSWIVRLGASLTPWHQAVDLSKTHQGASRVTLTTKKNAVWRGKISRHRWLLSYMHRCLRKHLLSNSHCMHLCLHPSVRRRTSCAWSCQDRLSHRQRRLLRARPNTAVWRACTDLKPGRTGIVRGGSETALVSREMMLEDKAFSIRYYCVFGVDKSHEKAISGFSTVSHFSSLPVALSSQL